MYLYAQLALAQIARTRLQPAYLDEYAWGVIAPDLFGPAGAPREHTHVTRQGMEELIIRYPQQRSFLQGYRIHLLLDELDLPRLIGRAFPLSSFKRLLARPLTADSAGLLVEDYFVRTTPLDQLPAFSEKHNRILDHLGFPPEQTAEYARQVRGYLSALALKKRGDALLIRRLYGSAPPDPRAGRPFLTLALRLAVKNAGLEKLATGMI